VLDLGRLAGIPQSCVAELRLIEAFWPCMKHFSRTVEKQTRPAGKGFQVGNHGTTVVIKLSRKMIKAFIS
jgi:hypothetical protein